MNINEIKGFLSVMGSDKQIKSAHAGIMAMDIPAKEKGALLDDVLAGAVENTFLNIDVEVTPEQVRVLSQALKKTLGKGRQRGMSRGLRLTP